MERLTMVEYIALTGDGKSPLALKYLAKLDAEARYLSTSYIFNPE